MNSEQQPQRQQTTKNQPWDDRETKSHSADELIHSIRELKSKQHSISGKETPRDFYRQQVNIKWWQTERERERTAINAETCFK